MAKVTYTTRTMTSDEGLAEVARGQARQAIVHVLAWAGHPAGHAPDVVRSRMPPDIREIKVTRDLSPGQVAQQTGFSRSLIYREIERNHLRAYKVSGRLRITPEALSEWKRRHTVRASPAHSELRDCTPHSGGAGWR
jgi:excisionase family DNA binding protein